MKYVKMLGLAAVAAMALMAFIGASSASATVLCTTTSTPCAGTAWQYKGVLVTSLEKETSATLSNTSGSIENTCNGSSVNGSIENPGSSTETVSGKVKVEGETKDLTFTGCTNTTDVLEGGELELHAIEGTDNGTLTAKKFRVTMNLSGISCTYGAGAGTHMGTVTGGEMATIDIHAIVNKQEGSFLCPGDAVWDAKYTVTEPAGPLYVEPR